MLIPLANNTIHMRLMYVCGPCVDLTSAACPCMGQLTRNVASSLIDFSCLNLLACSYFIVIYTLSKLIDLVTYVGIRLDRDSSLSTHIAPPLDTYTL